MKDIYATKFVRSLLKLIKEVTNTWKVTPWSCTRRLSILKVSLQLKSDQYGQ